MTRPTALTAPFGGRDRVFNFRLGEISEIEMLCGCGIAAVFTRVNIMQFRFADIRETIRLGLIGGGMVASEAAFLVAAYVDPPNPIGAHAQLAADILRALFDGIADAVKEDPPSGEAQGSGNPVTSPPSSQPASSQGSAPTP